MFNLNSNYYEKDFGLMLLCATMVGFVSSEKDDGVIYYAGKQKEIVDFFGGRTFVSTFAGEILKEKHQRFGNYPSPNK